MRPGFQTWCCDLPRASKQVTSSPRGLCPLICKKEVWTGCPEGLSSSEMLGLKSREARGEFLSKSSAPPGRQAPSWGRQAAAAGRLMRKELAATSWPGGCFHGQKKGSHLFSRFLEGDVILLPGRHTHTQKNRSHYSNATDISFQ